MKKCTKCNVEKPFEGFYKCASSHDGRQSRCSECTRNYNRAYYHGNPEKAHARVRGWRHQNAEAINERNRKRRPQIYFWVAKHTYGITKKQLEELEKSQGGVCAICKKRPESRLHIDHDHETTAIRGLLCLKCNIALGAFLDDPDLVEEAARYLRSRASYDARKEYAA